MNEHDRLKQHQTLYKVKTPPWKDSFREKCFQRLRSNRSRLVDKFRGMDIETKDVVDVVMKEEWNSFASKQNDLPNILEGNEAEVNQYLSILKDIQEELIEAERRILEEYYAEAEAKSISSTVDWLERDEVICPFCQKHGLHQNLSVIFCSCGFRIDTQQDGFTLENFKVQLGIGLETHGQQTCTSSPSFSLLQYCSVTNLAITCEACSFMYLVV